MDLISKDEAKLKGLKRYFTGIECKHGHISERDIRGKCIACHKAISDKRKDKKNTQSKVWRSKNKDKCKASNDSNRSSSLEYQKGYQKGRLSNRSEEDKESRKNYDKKYKSENRDKIRDRQKIYYQKNKLEILARIKEQKKESDTFSYMFSKILNKAKLAIKNALKETGSK